MLMETTIQITIYMAQVNGKNADRSDNHGQNGDMSSNYFCDDPADGPKVKGEAVELEVLGGGKPKAAGVGALPLAAPNDGAPNGDGALGAPNGDGIFAVVLKLKVMVDFFCSPCF